MYFCPAKVEIIALLAKSNRPRDAYLQRPLPSTIAQGEAEECLRRAHITLLMLMLYTPLDLPMRTQTIAHPPSEHSPLTI